MKRDKWDALVEKYKLQLDTSKLSGTDSAKAFEMLKQHVMEELDRPTHIAIIGKTGVGKTSTINSLFGTDWKISHVRAATKEEQVYIYESDRGRLKISDLPGFAEDIDTEKQHREIYRRVLKECDVALLILKADTRDMLDVQSTLRDVVGKSLSNLSRRIVIGLNQVDLVHPGDWIERANIPSSEQEKNIKKIINERVKSIKKVCDIKLSQVVAYSATKRYHLVHLFAAMVMSTSGQAWVLDAKKNIADYLELVDPKYLPAHLRRA
jgi:small GTP-binding protein